jgi:hypothetical protein
VKHAFPCEPFDLAQYDYANDFEKGRLCPKPGRRGPVNQSTVEIDPHFKERAHSTSSLKRGDNNVRIWIAWYHRDYLLDSLDHKEIIRTNLRFRTADKLSRAI